MSMEKERGFKSDMESDKELMRLLEEIIEAENQEKSS